jgi:hypothetical protein
MSKTQKRNNSSSSSSSSSSSTDAAKDAAKAKAAKAGSADSRNFLASLGTDGPPSKSAKTGIAKSRGSPAHKIKTTTCVSYRFYVWIDGIRYLVLIAIAQCYDCYGFLKGNITFSPDCDEMCCLEGFQLLYLSTREKRVREHGMEGLPDGDVLSALRMQGPLWCYSAMSSTVEEIIDESAKLEEFLEQWGRLLPGAADESNHATFALKNVNAEFEKDDATGNELMMRTMTALKAPANHST